MPNRPFRVTIHIVNVDQKGQAECVVPLGMIYSPTIEPLETVARRLADPFVAAAKAAEDAEKR